MPTSTPTTDAELIRRAREGQRDAFAALYRRHQRVVFRFAHAMSGSRPMAEDVTQDVFLHLMRELHRYDPTRAALQTYLYAVARNLTRHRLRRERRFAVLDEEQPESTMPVSPDDPAAPLERRQEIARIRRGIAALASRYREAVILCDLHELTYAEAAAILDVPVGTVRSRLHRGRQLLSARLRGLGRRRLQGTPSPTRCLA